MWGKLSTREKRMIILLITIIMIFLLYKYLWVSQFSHWTSLKDQIRQETMQITKNEQMVKQLPKLEQQLRQIEKDLSMVKEDFAIPITDGSTYVELGLQSQDKVSIVGVYPQPVVTKDYYQVLPMNIEVMGSYLGSLKFIQALESMPQVLEITQLNMWTVDGSTDQELRTDITLMLYSLKGISSGSLKEQWEVGRFDIFSPSLEQLLNKMPKAVYGYGEQSHGASEVTEPPGSISNSPIYQFPVR